MRPWPLGQQPLWRMDRGISRDVRDAATIAILVIGRPPSPCVAVVGAPRLARVYINKWRNPDQVGAVVGARRRGGQGRSCEA